MRNDEPAPCYPSHPISQCRHCSRRHEGEPPVNRLHIEVIDASIALIDGGCGMLKLSIPLVPEYRKAA